MTQNLEISIYSSKMAKNFKNWSILGHWSNKIGNRSFLLKNYETYNNERKETSFCKFKQISVRKLEKASNIHTQPVTDSK